MKTLIAIIILSLNATSFAEETVKYIDQGTPAPFSGYLMNDERAKRVRDISIDLESTKKINALLTEEKGILTQRLTESKEHIDYLSKELISTRDMSFLPKAGYFLLGAVLTGLVSYGAAKAIR